jgi:nucleoside phosphorylase
VLRILLVEDEASKKQLLTRTLCAEPGVTLENISFADNVREAKKLLSQYHFDLVVLDLNIPRAPTSSNEMAAGLEVLAFIRNNLKAIAPSYVFGLTAYDEAFAGASDAFESALWKLMRFSHTELSWQRALRSAIEYLVSKQTPPYATDGHTYHCDVGVVVALDEELAAILGLPCQWQKLQIPHDHSEYYLGTAKVQGRELAVVAAVAAQMGMTNMAIAATKLISAYHPRFVLSTGLCAGVRGKTDIGDILVADPCFDWGCGKWVRENHALKFLPAAYQWRVDSRLIAAVRETASEPGLLDAIHASFSGKKPASRPRVVIDAMASGASVVQVEEMMNDVKEQHRNLVGIEMENYALFAAGELASEPRPRCMAVKSVCDFGDERKNDNQRAYAIHTSTAFFWKVLEHEGFSD